MLYLSLSHSAKRLHFLDVDSDLFGELHPSEQCGGDVLEKRETRLQRQQQYVHASDDGEHRPYEKQNNEPNQ